MIIQQDLFLTNNNNIIEDQNIEAVITDLDIIDLSEGILELSLKILDEKYKNRVLKDRVSYHRNHQWTWKYLLLRECAGVPYDPNEGSRIDIAELLIDKKVLLNLSAWICTCRSGQSFKKQKIVYVYDRNKYNDNQSKSVVIPNDIEEDPTVDICPDEIF